METCDHCLSSYFEANIVIGVLYCVFYIVYFKVIGNGRDRELDSLSVTKSCIQRAALKKKKKNYLFLCEKNGDCH